MPLLDNLECKLGNRAVVILGMHRSGTSAMGGVLDKAGIEFGDNLYQAQKNVNEKGFWEHGPIVDCHDELLLQLGSSWDDPRPLPDRWWTEPVVGPFRQRLIRILQRDFAQTAVWGLKDPRMCRLMPLWRELFDALQVQPVFVIVVRTPLEVAASLAKRNSFSLDKSLLLWWQHQVLAEQETRGFPRVFVAYSQLMTDPEGTLGRIGAGLNLGLEADSIHTASTFLTPSMQHHKDLQFQGRSPLEDLVRDAFQVYLEAAGSGREDCLEQARQSFLSYQQTLNPVLLEHMDQVARQYRDAQTLLHKYYACLAVKAAKRLCILQEYLRSLISR